MSFKSSFGALEDAGGSWLGFGILILIRIRSLVFGTPIFRILAFILILKVQRTSMSFKSSFGALEEAVGSWLGFGILICFGYGHWFFIQPWSKFWLSIFILKVQRTSMSFRSLFGALEDAEGSWLGFGTLISVFWYTNVPNFVSLSCFWRCKEHPCPSSPDLGLWRRLWIPDWGLASWSWFGYGH